MYKFVSGVISVLLSVFLWAQAPQKFSYQSVIRSKSNSLLINQKVGLRISIIDSSSSGLIVYSERHEPNTNENGLISVQIGGGTVGKGDFTKIDWAKGVFYIRTETDPEGGNDYTVISENQLLSVPYALFAGNSQPGPKGDKGDQGATGPQGIQGPKGDTGTFPMGNNIGEMNYWDGKSWVGIPPASNGQILTICDGVPTWTIGGKCPETKPPTSGYGPSITDQDGNSYKTVYIGPQQWMAENLKTTKYSDGTPIPNVTDSTTWIALKTGAWVNYNNDAKYDPIYGKLYNGFVIRNDKNVCPSGWHVPKAVDWNYLMYTLGGDSIAGDKLRSTDTTTLWLNPSEAAKMGIESSIATNSSLFTALPGGVIYDRWGFDGIRSVGFWWGESAYDSSYANIMIMSYKYKMADIHVNNSGKSKKNGFSIRCVKDGTTPNLLGTIQELDCSGPSNTGVLVTNTPANDVTTIIAYSGGNGGTYAKQEVASKGVLGLTARLSAGTLDLGNGLFTYEITGTPTTSGTATFDFSFGNKTCSITRNVIAASNSGYGPNIKDADNNIYKTVVIGTQTWMAENLKTSKYNDGSSIPNVKEDIQWSNLNTPAWSNYNNDVTNDEVHGKLYNWFSVNSVANGNKNICPSGWHIPSQTEWNTLTDYLGGNELSGEKMRTTNLNYWNSSTLSSTNSSLFTALASGSRFNGGNFGDLKEVATWWTSNEINSSSSSFVYLLKDKSGPNSCSTCFYNLPKQTGLSIRCIKD